MEVDRDGPTYTVDTLRGLKDELGEKTDLFFITGADAMLEIFQWKDREELFELAHFIAATRPGLRHRARSRPHAHGRAPSVTVMNIPALAISSTDIRGRVATRATDPLPGARGREVLHREGGAVPVRPGADPGAGPGGPRSARGASSPRTAHGDRRRGAWSSLVVGAGVVGVRARTEPRRAADPWRSRVGQLDRAPRRTCSRWPSPAARRPYLAVMGTDAPRVAPGGDPDPSRPHVAGAGPGRDDGDGRREAARVRASRWRCRTASACGRRPTSVMNVAAVRAVVDRGWGAHGEPAGRR